MLNKLKRKTGKGNAWSQSRVASARQANDIEGQKQLNQRGTEILSLAQAANYCGVSNTTICKLVEAKILPMQQIAPWAPWEINRSDLERPAVQTIIGQLRKTGKLELRGITLDKQQNLFE